jgi:hypothetical protein
MSAGVLGKGAKCSPPLADLQPQGGRTMAGEIRSGTKAVVVLIGVLVEGHTLRS